MKLHLWANDKILCGQDAINMPSQYLKITEDRDKVTCGNCLKQMPMKTKRQAGYDSHVEWEKSRGNENECDRERYLREEDDNQRLTPEWWNGWFERSDEWRDELEESE